jgi:hypothetical protein
MFAPKSRIKIASPNRAPIDRAQIHGAPIEIFADG